MQSCHFCGASLAGVARPVGPVKKTAAGPAPWIMTLYYIVAGYWIFGGAKEIITDAIGIANLQAKPDSPAASFSFVLYIMIVVGLFQLVLGTGLLLKWEWARAVVNFFCWVRIALGLLGLYTTILAVPILGAMAIVYVFFHILDLVMAGLQIWLIGETDYTFTR